MNTLCNKLYRFVNTSAICIFSVYRIVVRKFFCKKEKRNTKEIILIMVAGIGDCVLFLDGMKKLRNYYSKKDGYHIRFVSNETLTVFCEQHGGCELDEYISLGKGNVISFTNLFRVYRRLNRYQPEIVLSFWPGYRALTAAWINSKANYCLRRKNRGMKEVKLMQRILPYAFNGIVYWETNKMMYEVIRDLLRMSGVNDYKTEIGRLENVKKIDAKKQKALDIRGEYCVVVPGSQDTAKRWEIEKFTVCIAHILNTYRISVLIMGVPGEKDIGEKIKQNFHKDGEVVNLIGKTSPDDLVSIISDSKFVFGNDTGSIHIAAALGVPSVLVMSYRESGYHPYVVDVIREDDKIPVGIWAKDIPKCSGCLITSNISKRRIKCSNRTCVDDIYQRKPFYCLSQVTVEDVVSSIDALFKL